MLNFTVILCTLVIVFELCCSRRITTTHMFCGSGEFLDNNSKNGLASCQPCPTGTFMDEAKHTNVECAACTEAEDFNNDVEAQACTSTKDAVILCDKNHFRVEPGSLFPGFCERCLVCGEGRESKRPFEIQPCGKYTNTVCVA